MKYLKSYKLFEDVNFHKVNFSNDEKLQISDILLPLIQMDFHIDINGSQAHSYRHTNSLAISRGDNNFMYSDVKDSIEFLNNYLRKIRYSISDIRVYSKTASLPLHKKVSDNDFDGETFLVCIDIRKN